MPDQTDSAALGNEICRLQLPLATPRSLQYNIPVELPNPPQQPAPCYHPDNKMITMTVFLAPALFSAL